jgi:hypothetical protein
MGACGPVGSTIDSEYYLIFYSDAVILEAAGLPYGPWSLTAVGIAWNGRAALAIDGRAAVLTRLGR